MAKANKQTPFRDENDMEVTAEERWNAIKDCIDISVADLLTTRGKCTNRVVATLNSLIFTITCMAKHEGIIPDRQDDKYRMLAEITKAGMMMFAKLPPDEVHIESGIDPDLDSTTLEEVKDFIMAAAKRGAGN